MFWTGFLLGAFLGVNIGIIVIGLFISTRREPEYDSDKTPMELAPAEELEEVQGEMPPMPKPLSYLDRFPHS
jgi:hypothetical protein